MGGQTSMLRILFYIITIVLANVITAATLPMNLGVMIVPYGTLFIGATFALRDLVQLKYGRKMTYYIICVALLMSALTSHLLGDPLNIVIASAIAFSISESIDTEIFSRLKAQIAKRVIYSGLIGSIFDSFVFAVVGLIPAGFITWSDLPMAILGQVLFKSIMLFPFAWFMSKRYK
jgi:uncharacterized PurR-regulated membrane protein YhhQ (DUF165 family)